MNTKKRLLWIIIPVVLFIAIFFGLLYVNYTNKNYSNQGNVTEITTEEATKLIASPEDALIVVNLDVGHGDCAILHTGTEYGIVDTGPEESRQVVTDYLNANHINEIKFMLITHYDKDHIGNAVEILKNYDVETVFIPDYVSKKALYEPLMLELNNASDVRKINTEYEYKWNDVNIHLYPAGNVADYTKDGEATDNDLSLVSIVSYCNKRLLFLGDVEKDRIKEMLNSGVNYKCDWMKMPHHGREGKKIDKLIDAVHAKFAIVSCGEDDNFIGNENEKYLKDNKVDVFTTLDCNIITKCDGLGLNVMYVKDVAADSVLSLVKETKGMTVIKLFL